LIFRVSQWEFAIPSRMVNSIVPAPSILPIPGMPVWLAGLLQTGGAATPVIDMRGRLGLGGSDSAAAVVVIEQEQPEGPFSFGLLVDKVVDMAMVRNSEVQQMRESSTLPFKDLLVGAWRGRSRACYLVNVEKLAPEDFHLQMQAVFSSFR